VAAYGVDRAGVRGGDVVLVTGAGPIGMLSALYASAVGASTVVIAEPNPRRAALARAIDVGPVVDPTSGELESVLADVTRGSGVDVGVECSGTTPGLGSCIANARPRGTVVQTGLHTKPATLDAMGLASHDVTLIGSWCYLITDWPRIIRLVASGKYAVSKVVTANIDLADVVTKGFDVLVDPMGDQLKVLVRPER
jgi:(R,R)-butanediol dehydrogenase/meso-butanediol dehydrogenase/diacetyl reductase